MSETNTTGNPPEKKFRAGAISASVWKNNVTTKDGREAEIMSVTFQRSYKDKKTDEWKRTSSLRTMDLPKAVVVLNKAYEYLVLNGQSDLAAETS
jgi:hypothetical protein